MIHWADLKDERLLLPQRGPGPEFFKLLIGKIRCSEPCRILRHDVALDRLLTEDVTLTCAGHNSGTVVNS